MSNYKASDDKYSILVEYIIYSTLEKDVHNMLHSRKKVVGNVWFKFICIICFVISKHNLYYTLLKVAIYASSFMENNMEGFISKC